jgi:hypothetical protein
MGLESTGGLGAPPLRCSASGAPQKPDAPAAGGAAGSCRKLPLSTTFDQLGAGLQRHRDGTPLMTSCGKRWRTDRVRAIGTPIKPAVIGGPDETMPGDVCQTGLIDQVTSYRELAPQPAGESVPGCLFWVKLGPRATLALSPVHPKLRTLVGATGRSLPCQDETSARCATQKHLFPSNRPAIHSARPAQGRFGFMRFGVQ